MFDLPSTTNEDKATYRKFRNFLLKKGFIMMQESIYTKLALNRTISNSYKNLVKKNIPKNGLIQMLEITEKQFQSIDILIGSDHSTICQSMDRYIEL